MKTKNLIQRSLPITTTYEIIGSRYTSIEDGGGCCENCGKAITNIAIIKSKEGRIYNVGMDCAATLSGIKDSFDFNYIHKANFATAKNARNQLLRMIKEDKIKSLQVKTFEDKNNFYKQLGSGKWEVEIKSGGYNWKQYQAGTWLDYVLPMIKDLVF